MGAGPCDGGFEFSPRHTVTVPVQLLGSAGFSGLIWGCAGRWAPVSKPRDRVLCLRGVLHPNVHLASHDRAGVPHPSWSWGLVSETRSHIGLWSRGPVAELGFCIQIRSQGPVSEL